MIRILFLIGCLAGIDSAAADNSFRPQAQLQALVDRADLIIVATPQTVCSGGNNSGPWLKPGEDKLVSSYNEFLPQLKVDQILKGDVARNQTLWVSYTTINVMNGKNLVVLDPSAPKGSLSNPVFNVKGRSTDEVSTPGSPRKGTAYVFFLENRKKREPGSYEAAGKNEILYRNFDYWFGMVPASDALVFQVKELARAKQS